MCTSNVLGKTICKSLNKAKKRKNIASFEFSLIFEPLKYKPELEIFWNL